jgi:hypothetical protein
MKKLLILSLLLCFSVPAFAAGKRTVDPNNRNMAYNSPDKSSATCTTTTTTKGTIATFTVAGYSQLCYEASDSSNAAKRIKRHIGNNTAYMPGTGTCIGLNDSQGTIVFKPYSAASAAYTVCWEAEKGGKTP